MDIANPTVQQLDVLLPDTFSIIEDFTAQVSNQKIRSTGKGRSVSGQCQLATEIHMQAIWIVAIHYLITPLDSIT